MELGWELMGHGRNNNEHLNGKTEAEERQIISETLATIEKFSGRRPTGWLGPALGQTPQTLDLLAEYGIRYVADYVNDEQPHYLNTIHGPIGAVPTSTEVNDLIGVIARHYTSAPEMAEMFIDQRSTSSTKRATRPDASCAWCCTRRFPARHFCARHIKKALAHMRSRKDVWFATASEIWAAYQAAVPAR